MIFAALISGKYGFLSSGFDVWDLGLFPAPVVDERCSGVSCTTGSSNPLGGVDCGMRQHAAAFWKYSTSITKLRKLIAKNDGRVAARMNLGRAFKAGKECTIYRASRSATAQFKRR